VKAKIQGNDQELPDPYVQFVGWAGEHPDDGEQADYRYAPAKNDVDGAIDPQPTKL